MSEIEYSVVDLGAVTAYAQAVENGYTGTLEQWAQLQINSANNYQELFNEIYTKDSSAALWEQGGLSMSTGASASSTTRIRTTDFLPDSVAKITTETGYYIILYAYYITDGSFVGVLKNDYDLDPSDGEAQIEFLTSGSYAAVCLTGSIDIRRLKIATRGANGGMKFKVLGAYGGAGTTAITPAAASNFTFYENNVGYAIDNDLIAIGENEPSSERAVMWINDDASTEIHIPEIDDAHISDIDTWSSEKIDEEMGDLKSAFVDAMGWSRKTPMATADNYKINANGYAVYDSNYMMVKYAVAGGDEIFVKSATPAANMASFIFADYSNISQQNLDHLVGTPVTTPTSGLITVPDGALYIVFSCQKTDDASGIYVANRIEKAEAINDDIYYDIEVEQSATSGGWRLNSYDGLCSQNSSYKLVKYQVNEGQRVRIVSDDRFQFQSNSSVPSSGQPNRIGDTYGNGTFLLTVPENASYLIISTPLESNASVVSLVTCKQKIAELNNAIYAECRRENQLGYDAFGNYNDGAGYNIQVGYGVVSAKFNSPATSLYLELKNPVNKIEGSSSATKYISLKGKRTYKLRTILISGSFEGSDSYAQCMISSGNSSSDYVQTARGGSITFSYASDTNVSLIFYVRYSTTGNIVFQYSLEDITDEWDADKIKYACKLNNFIQDATQYTKGNTSGSWYDRFVFLHISDSHVGASFAEKNLNELVNVANSLQVNAVIHSGDMTMAGGTNVTKAKVLSLFDTNSSIINGIDSNIPVIETLGNHDSNDVTDVNVDYISTKKDQWDHIFAPIADKYDSIVWGDSANYKHYHYCDITAGDYKIRIISLDGLDHADYASGDSRYNCHHWEVYSQDQIDWLCNTALNVPSGNYGVIINNHFPFAPKRNAGYSEQWPALNDGYFAQGWKMIPEIVRAWTNRETLSKTYSDAKLNLNNITVNADFSSVPSGAVFVCYTTGHTHSKNAFTVKEENGENFNQLMLCEDSSGQQGSALNRVYKYDNGLENTAASQIAIDMAEHKVYRTAYGAYQHCSNTPMPRTEIFDF